MPTVGVFSYSAGAIAFLMLSLVLLTGQRGRLQKHLLLLASLVSVLWLATVAAQLYLTNSLFESRILELLRNLVWVIFLSGAVTAGYGDIQHARRRFRSLVLLAGSFILMLVSLTSHRYFSGHAIVSSAGIDWLLAGHMVVAIFGLILIEQLIRNVRPESRRAVKYLCVGVGGLFVYDFYLYSDALLFQRIDLTLWEARGVINALAVPLIGVAIARDPQWSVQVYVSRRVVFHTVALLGTGVYLLAMGAGGYFVRSYGGSWGGVAQVIFLCAALLLLAVLLFSAQLRAYLRVIINKHFFHYKYEYRDEWLRFIGTLTTEAQGDNGLQERTIQAMANIVDSPGGLLWLRRDPDRYECVAGWCLNPSDGAVIAADSQFTHYLETEQWVINLDEYARDFHRYGGLQLPEWFNDYPEAWVVTPLILHDRLMGFVTLTRAPSTRHFNWEDYDLLRTVGRQAAAHLAQLDASKALAEAKQFEACSQLSAYVMHDLKNLIAQLSLVVSNAAKHKHNPQFMEDVITTVDNSVNKMSGLLAHIRSGGVQAKETKDVDVCEMLCDVVETMSSGLPIPHLDCQATGIKVRCNLDRFAAVTGHVIRNAQDATPDDGRLMVRLFKQGEQAVIEVQDSGAGMDEAFIREQLFRPFVSTKGASGMGIGVFETREFIRGLGGDVEVISRVGEGSTFRLRVPISEEAKNNVKLATEEQREQSRNPNDNKYKETASC